MYGLLIESIMDYIRKRFGDEAWESIRQKAGIPHTCFSTHETYSEQLIPKIADSASQVIGLPEDELMDAFGVAFVSFVGQYGYDSILKVLGRHMRDFLNGLDNLHEYLRFSYPKLRPPSFFVENENKNGLTLHYRSRRKGFVHYVKGQIRRVGELFYSTKVDIFVVGQHFNKDDNTTHVTFRLLLTTWPSKTPGKLTRTVWWTTSHLVDLSGVLVHKLQELVKGVYLLLSSSKASH
ncbi:hypothetical protein C0Q70_04834 [Pomacea canaliculata]|uniref:Heme NO-binding domain-containing protein n=1 Tax=Pomacea canaliculata TaxID=400727 RepID=A0A2T7PJL6_POMCA|nr:hypothetical protein C0Q70_04834 [Pomacea canaliculata]